MPYNTTAIPPKKEPTGQTQLPLSRVKKIISQDSDINMCSNNAAFIITCAAASFFPNAHLTPQGAHIADLQFQEMFIQHLADESHTQAKLERKPRRNIQYKDVANAVARQDHLEFLEDVVPKTVPYKAVKAAASETQARLRGETKTDESQAASNQSPAATTNGNTPNGKTGTPSAHKAANKADGSPNDQLELEMRQAHGSKHDADVQMTG
ncbi:unnamed protein product [Clonostachys solani]|uniref:Transcription factor CBF/NF-Y/archaeal histone domain-containing protein n=1 Tax=Clonostachys solani TaxID=160281 RepID=A0A9N9ZQA9_9HYPO|nr:unnamed protein product [Clonostachys solani]